MTDENGIETVAKTPLGREGDSINWTRIEGVLGVSALITSFVWFLGMPTGMAIGVGFGSVLVLDFVRALLLDASRSDRSTLGTQETTRQ